MIAADSSSFIAHLSGDQGEDVEILDQAFSDRLVVVPPVVLVELLSDPKLPSSVSDLLKALPGRYVPKLYPEAEKPGWQIR